MGRGEGSSWNHSDRKMEHRYRIRLGRPLCAASFDKGIPETEPLFAYLWGGGAHSSAQQFIPSWGSLFLESSIKVASLITDTQLVLILPFRDAGMFAPAGKMAGKEPSRIITSSHSENRAYGLKRCINLSCLLKALVLNLGYTLHSPGEP